MRALAVRATRRYPNICLGIGPAPHPYPAWHLPTADMVRERACWGGKRRHSGWSCSRWHPAGCRLQDSSERDPGFFARAETNWEEAAQAEAACTTQGKSGGEDHAMPKGSAHARNRHPHLLAIVGSSVLQLAPPTSLLPEEVAQHLRAVGSAAFAEDDPWFVCQHRIQLLQAPVIPLPEGPTPSSGLYGHCTHMHKHNFKKKKIF